MILFSTVDGSAVVFVDGSRPGGDGSSWASAFKSLEAAISASESDQEFWIAKGRYTPARTLLPKEGTSFYGGFAGSETRLSQRNVIENRTVIDGMYRLPHVFSVRGHTSRVVFDGLTIRRGKAVGDGQEAVGGAILITRSSALIRNCTFTENSAEFGGAIYSWDSELIIDGSFFYDNRADKGIMKRGGAIWINLKSPLIRNCTFSGNSAGRHGGAVELNNTPNATISFSTFIGNTAEIAGGGVALFWNLTSPKPSVSIEKCLFKNNRGKQEGGGVYSYYFPTATRQCDFIGNHAERGGAIKLDYKLNSSCTINRSRFIGNSAIVTGGAISSFARSMIVENSLFAFNSVSNGGGGALLCHSGWNTQYYNENYTINVTNCTLYGNSAAKWGGAISNSGVQMEYITNSILWGNKAGLSYWNPTTKTHDESKDVANNGPSSMTVRNTDMESLEWAHGSIDEIHLNSFALAPLFVDPDGSDNIPGTEDDNFQLQATSPCVDMADGGYAADCDLSCYPRIDHGRVVNSGTGSPDYSDIGALERLEDSSTVPCPSCVLTMPYVPPPPSSPSEGGGLAPLLYLLLR